jgi:hypothetical protein
MPDPKQSDAPAGWHSRGYLPHFDGGEIPQFITSRLADSMPQKLLDKWKEELSSEQTINVDAALRKRIETYLDQGYVGVLLKRSTRRRVSSELILIFRWKALPPDGLGDNAESCAYVVNTLRGPRTVRHLALTQVLHRQRSKQTPGA